MVFDYQLWILTPLITLPTKVYLVKAMVFFSGHVWMWELDCEESWVLKNWCFWTVVLEKTFESPFDCKEIKPVHPRGDQSWMFIGRTDAKAEAPIFGNLMQKTDSLEKTLMLGKIEDRREWENEMVGWHHWLYGHEFEHALGVDDGQGSLACCSPWGCKELDTTAGLNWTEPQVCFYICT